MSAVMNVLFCCGAVIAVAVMTFLLLLVAADIAKDTFRDWFGGK